jgi:DNA-binding GntR family transcriptional regulator
MPERTSSQGVVREIYTTLLDRIVKSEYPENQWLREEAIAKEFGVSRSPVRRALRLLHQDGMVDLVPKRGARLFPFTADDIEDIYEIRKTLESLAIRVGIQNLSIQRLLSLRNQIQALREVDDPEEHTRIDGVLHSYLIEASGRRRLVSMLNELYRLSQSLRQIGLRDRNNRLATIDEHSGIIDALTVRDLDQATTLLVRHIENSKARLLMDVTRTDERPPKNNS